MRLEALLAITLLTVGIAGCIGTDEAVDANAAPTPPELLDGVLDLLDDGFSIEVPVDVVLVGFPPETVAALDERLATEEVHHASLDLDRSFPPDPAALSPPLSGSINALPARPTAVYRVHDATDALHDDVVATAAANEVGEGLYLANPVEDLLADSLATAGVPMDANTPPLVVLHLGEALGTHGWRYQYPNGHLDDVRVFGERRPVLVFDASAAPDPYVFGAGGGLLAALQGDGEPTPRKPYYVPVDPTGEDTVDAIQLAVSDATHFRLLQGSIYPATTKSCHAVTLVLGIRATSLTEQLPTFADALDTFDVETLDSAWENITGEGTVEVDLEVLLLPVEDPVLDAIARGSLGTLDATRWWFDENWENYHVAHEGCEPYLSFIVYGDVTEPLTFGIATYDPDKSHRISFSTIDERFRIQDEYRGPGEEVVSTNDGSVYTPARIFRLFGHETGHLIGQRHPHDVTGVNGGGGESSWSSVWSIMSYQNRDRVTDFGAIDHANFQRNRAGYVVAAAMDAGLEGTPAFEEAMVHLEQYHWQAAAEALVPHIQG